MRLILRTLEQLEMMKGRASRMPNTRPANAIGSAGPLATEARRSSGNMVPIAEYSSRRV
jgi:hypothetical protein